MTDLNDLFNAVGRIEGKLDTVLAKQDDQETRIRSLERSRSWAIGAAAGTGALVAFLWNTFFGSKN